MGGKSRRRRRRSASSSHDHLKDVTFPDEKTRIGLSDLGVLTGMVANAATEAAFAEYALPVGAVLSDGQFTIKGHLGAGGFGITYTAQDNVLGRTVVLKECFPYDFCMRERNSVVVRSHSYAQPFHQIVSMFMREARSLARLRHPNIVGVHGAFEEFGTAYMVLDLIEGAELADFIHPDGPELSPARIRDILLKLLDAVEEVHALDLLHRDISPDNIIIEASGAPVLIDFGAARGEASRQTRAVSSLLVVKDGYSPQEFYVEGSRQSPSSDLYALAASFYHLLSGEPPPHSQMRLIELAGRKSDPCKPLAGRIGGYDTAFLEAIDRAMQVHPSDRLQSAAQWRGLIADSSAGSDVLVTSVPRVSKTDVSLAFERSLTRLVEETNKEVSKGRAAHVDVAAAIPPPPEKPSKPDWVEEFNRDSAGETSVTAHTLRPDVGSAGAPGSRPEPKIARTTSETNWIERINRRNERELREREADLGLLPDPGADPDCLVSGPPLRTATDRADHRPARRTAPWPTRVVAYACVLTGFVFLLDSVSPEELRMTLAGLADSALSSDAPEDEPRTMPRRIVIGQ